ncbi:MAG: DUF4062 domain-containing protein [Bacteroidetes bacterium]|nr:DUF4062 domain-containing protein [Bacteroidota bacterium]
MLKPKVFISSTCYDLSQIRQTISSTLENLEYIPILSDSNSFPNNPFATPIENCIENVEKNADMLILIVGSRYGSTGTDGQSITNKEYETAILKGIPIYVFINQEVLAFLKIWENNKDANYSGIIDSPKLFEFISDVYSSNSQWVFPFNNASDIEKTLKMQFSYFFHYLLLNYRHESTSKYKEFFPFISIKAKKFLIEEKILFELNFFYQVLIDENMKFKDLLVFLNNDIFFRCAIYINSKEELIAYINRELKSLKNFSKTFIKLIGLWNNYMSLPQLEERISNLLFTAKAFSELTKEVIEWALDAKNVSCYDEASGLLGAFSQYADSMIKTILNIPTKLNDKIDQTNLKIQSLSEDSDEIISIDLNFEITIDPIIVTKFHEEFDILYESE